MESFIRCQYLKEEKDLSALNYLKILCSTILNHYFSMLRNPEVEIILVIPKHALHLQLESVH